MPNTASEGKAGNQQTDSRGWVIAKINTVKPVLSGISMDQKNFPLKPGFRLIKVHYI
jgi:hypothetical protein